MESAIITEGLGKIYPGGSRALADVSIQIQPGELVAIIGPSGAGKSTLLRCVNRLIDPTEGRLILGGQEITRVSGRAMRRVRQRAGMIFQQFNLVSRLTVIENVLIGRLRFRAGSIWGPLAHARLFAPSDRAIAMEMLERVGIAGFAHRKAQDLSGGQQQRVAIARLLAQDPEIVLADEPIASLDPGSAAMVMDSLKRMNTESGKTVIVNLHQLDIATSYATRIIAMREGRICCDCAPDRLADHELRLIYASSDPCKGADPGDAEHAA